MGAITTRECDLCQKPKGAKAKGWVTFRPRTIIHLDGGQAINVEDVCSMDCLTNNLRHGRGAKGKESAYQEVCRRFERPQVEAFGEDSFRAILWDWRCHEGASCGQLSGHGKTLEQACEHLLHCANKAEEVSKGQCQSCKDWVE